MPWTATCQTALLGRNRKAGCLFGWKGRRFGHRKKSLAGGRNAKWPVFVPGKFFFVHRGEGNATLRLNYTMADAPTIDRAISVIAETICAELGEG